MSANAGRPLLGLIEGFYGPPWTWAERDRMIDFLAAHGFDLYVYAPKDDPLHRARWRDPLPEPELVRFDRLARRAAVAGVEFSYGLSPIDLGFGDRSGVEVVVRKCLQLAASGVSSFGLLFDDLPVDLPPSADERTEAARWQGSVANEVLRAVRESGAGGRFLFCPTEYCSSVPTPTPYLRTLGETLEAGIEVFWTGPQVCSHTITSSDLTAVTEGLQRRPLLWDNYPVNDGEMRWDPHIRPLRGRGADLPGACSGIVANGAIEAEATKIALHTFAAYWRDPSGYDPETAWGPALTAVAGDAGVAAALRVLGELASRSPIEPGQEPPVLWLEAFWTRWETVNERDAATTEVEAHLERLSDAAVHLIAAAERRPLPREMEQWARKLAAWVETARSALGVMRGRSDPMEVAARLERTLAMPHRVSDGRFEAFVRRCLDFHE
ncbi:MAG: beta-N-acetylglucosaminidase domain-containing protein [Chloroflexi bacterium]|nr:beta-N-acetylglucosaminidase domain-containing protein [Chloroflexota bacterium]